MPVPNIKSICVECKHLRNMKVLSHRPVPGGLLMSPERNGAPGPPQQMLELVKEKMNMCKAFCMPLQGPVLECDEYRDGSEEMPGDYNWYAKKKKETEKYKDALQSIKHHIEGQESALAVAIKATCDGALLAEDGKEINTTDGKKK